MKAIAEKITLYLVQNNYIESSKQKWCVYFLQKKMLTACSSIMFLIIGFFNNHLFETILFVWSFTSLRKRTGGFHLKSAFLCLIMSSLIVLLLPQFLSYIYLLNKYTVVLLLTVCCFVICVYSPVNHPNIHFNNEEMQKNKQYAIKTLFFIISGIIVLTVVKQLSLANSIVLAVLYDAVFIIIAKITGQEVKNNGYERKNQICSN